MLEYDINFDAVYKLLIIGINSSNSFKMCE